MQYICTTKKLLFMATNKDAIIRYQALDKCFSNFAKKYFIEDLVEECNKALYEFNGNTEGIKKRQVFYDINFMESEQGWAIPLEKISDGRKKYYRYSDTKFSINNQPLNDTEIKQLKSVIEILSRFKGMPNFEWVEDIFTKLNYGLKIENNENKIVGFDSNIYLKGIEFFSEIYFAIVYEKVLEIHYKSYRSVKKEIFEIHPYYLKQYNNWWFLFGYNPEKKDITNIALDRIDKINELRNQYIRNSDYDFSDYFEDIIGVTKFKTNKIEKIILSFSKEQIPYIISKPIHGSQKIIKKIDDELIISIEIMPNHEFESLILSYGNRVKIIEPEYLALKFKDIYKMCYDKYWKQYFIYKQH